MTLDQLAKELSDITFPIFIYTNPNPLDFTDKDSEKWLIISTVEKDIQIPLKSYDLMELTGLLTAFFNNKQPIITFDIKSFFSYCLFNLKRSFVVSAPILDLKVIEGFQGKHNDSPINFIEAKNRLKLCLNNQNWKTPYTTVYINLIKTVLPAIEITPILDRDNRDALYGYYDIETQVNGRLIAKKAFKYGYNPHGMTHELKAKYAAPGLDNIFMHFDYKNMEVSVLQKLSGDINLENILNNSDDFYSNLWELLMGTPVDKTNRNKAKLMFLPVFFGLGKIGLAKNLEINEELSQNLIDKIHKTFPVSIEWIKDSVINNGVVTDDLGRIRHFSEEDYLTRSFKVQAPAALICLEKLNSLYNSVRKYAKIICHQHDGYYLSVPRGNQLLVEELARKSLESESQLLPGLKLKLVCREGKNLNEMIERN